jgi:GLPGLI family protein
MQKISLQPVFYTMGLLIMFTPHLNAQTVTATYTTHYKAAMVNEFDNNNLTHTYKHKIKIPNAEYSYVYSGKRSLYTLVSGPGLVKTTAINPTTSKSTPHTMDYPSAETFFKDLQTETLLLISKTSKGTKNYSSDLQVYKWKITNEKKTILKHPCRKATCHYNNMTVTAWYATDIKINDGPARFWGLPGLILKISIGDYLETTATRIETEKASTEIVPPVMKKETRQ